MTGDRPYVDQRVTDVEHATRVAVAAADSWDLPTPTLLRHGMNAIFACDDVVLRVGRASAPAAASHELVATLVRRGIATVPPVPGLAADRDGYAVTAWERVEAVDVPVDWEAVGALLALVHRLDTSELPGDYPMPTPSTFPWWDFDAMIADTAEQLGDRPLAAIRAAIDEGRWWAGAVDAGTTVCHGDVHPGNVLVGADGPLLIDWDLMCIAPPAWDHAMLTTYAEMWGGPGGAYAAFASGYGASFADDELTRTIARLRNVAATLMRVKAGLSDETAREEARRRLRYWAGDRDAPTWRAQ